MTVFSTPVMPCWHQHDIMMSSWSWHQCQWQPYSWDPMKGAVHISGQLDKWFKSCGSFCTSTPVPHNCYLVLWALMMSSPPESAFGSGIVIQGPINVPLPTYDWNAPDQMWEFQIFKCQITSWKKIHWITSDEVDCLSPSLARKDMLLWIMGYPLTLQTKMMLGSSSTTKKVP